MAPPAAALLAAAGLMTPVGFEPLNQDEDCRYLVAQHREDGWPTIRAECLWEHIPPAELEALLGNWSGYSHHFSTIATSTVLGPQGATTAVHHVHTAPLMADREAILLFWSEEVGTGRAFRWTLAPHQPPVAAGRVGLVLDTGHWTVTPNPEGSGSLVVSELTYDPGGRVPAALVHWFQQAGVSAFVDELETAVTD